MINNFTIHLKCPKIKTMKGGDAVNVIDFQAAKAAREESAELEKILNSFRQEIVPHLTLDDKRNLLTAIETDDHDLYMEVIRPIVYRNVLRELNKKEGL